MDCDICERGCKIPPDGTGMCGMYTADREGRIRERFPNRYLAAVDTAIEAMPMVHYHPKGTFLQVCTVGCNFTCPGCVSEVLTDHLSAVRGQFQEMTPEQVLDRAKERGCIGVMFCFNEPTVSFFTFKRLAAMAREQGLLAGCATNGYMTKQALAQLIPFLDFVNVGIKGTSPSVCRACGIPDAQPIFRNIKALYQAGVHIEISAVFRKGQEAEVEETAAAIASLSRQVPFQVMRFLPFGKSESVDEPSVGEAEALCRRIRLHLDHVYLFNTPGTQWLNSFCPDCGAPILERGFFGPMCSNLHRFQPDGKCSCGYRLPFTGKIHAQNNPLTSGYFGGYRTVNAMSMIRSILGVLGVRDKGAVDAVMADSLRTDLIKGLYERLNGIEAYFDTVDAFAGLTGTEEKAALFREYAGARVEAVRKGAAGTRWPRVYYSLGHPLIAMFGEKMESRLARTAGCRLTNSLLDRDSRPGIMISEDDFLGMAPEIIIVSDGVAWPAADVTAFCRERNLDVPAVRNGQIFHPAPYRCATNPDWILGLIALANRFHPDRFSFDLEKEADLFYNTFYGQPFNDGRLPNFPWEAT